MKRKKKRERVQKYLTANKGCSIPHNFIFLQTHAAAAQIAGKPDERIERLDMGVAHYVRIKDKEWRNWQRIDFTSSGPLWPWVLERFRQNTSLWLVGHGIAKSFTLCEGWEQIDRRVFRLSKERRDERSLSASEKEVIEEQDGWLVDGDPPTILLLYCDMGVIHVVDSRNYFDASIEDYARETGRKAPQEPTKSKDPRQWFEYLHHQCHVVSDWLLEFMLWWQSEDLGQWRHTLPGLSMAAFRHKFMKSKILIHTCDFALAKEREALAGGELRSFYCGRVRPLFHPDHHARARTRIGKQEILTGPVHVYDVNSLYPAMMRDMLFPKELVAWKRPGDFEDFRVWSKTLLLLARVRLSTKSEAYPYFAKGKRHWAVGDFWTTLCGPELTRAVELGHVTAWDGLCAYLPSKCFVPFVEYFHRCRLLAAAAGKTLMAKQASLLMQSLAGKFGQRSPTWEFVSYNRPLMQWGTWPIVDADTKQIRIFRAISGWVQEKKVSTEGLESVPSLEAFVNCYGRDFMRSVRLAIGEENVLYQSTDALHVLAQAADKMKPFLETYPGELGKFKHLGTHERADYRGPHDYTLDDTHVIAGVKFDTEIGKDGSYSQWMAPALKSILTHEPNGFLRVEIVRHKIGAFHPNGILHKDGRVTPPIAVGGELQYHPVEVNS
jgi:hypothetical protein